MVSDPQPTSNDRAASAGEAGYAADDAEIRYSLTALGEALLSERAGRRFRGFGPCAVAALTSAGRH